MREVGEQWSLPLLSVIRNSNQCSEHRYPTGSISGVWKKQFLFSLPGHPQLMCSCIRNECSPACHRVEKLRMDSCYWAKSSNWPKSTTIQGLRLLLELVFPRLQVPRVLSGRSCQCHSGVCVWIISHVTNSIIFPNPFFPSFYIFISGMIAQ
jgi:hypothetical protein